MEKYVVFDFVQCNNEGCDYCCINFWREFYGVELDFEKWVKWDGGMFCVEKNVVLEL